MRQFPRFFYIRLDIPSRHFSSRNCSKDFIRKLKKNSPRIPTESFIESHKDSYGTAGRHFFKTFSEISEMVQEYFWRNPLRTLQEKSLYSVRGEFLNRNSLWEFSFLQFIDFLEISYQPLQEFKEGSKKNFLKDFSEESLKSYSRYIFRTLPHIKEGLQ